MSVTISDCLQLPSLSLGHVVAGDKGLDNIVNTVDVIEFILDEDVLPTPNVLFISAFYIIKDNVDAQCQEIFKCKELGSSGIVLFYSDFILHTLDKRVMQIADQLELPIIVLPGNDLGLHYCDVIEEVMEAIFIDRKDTHKFVSNTLEMMAQLNSSSRNISTLLNYASNYTKSSLFLCDEKARLIASSNWPRNNSDISLQMLIQEFGSTKSTTNMNNVHITQSGTEYHMKPFLDKSKSRLILYGVSSNNVLNATMMDQISETIQLFITFWNYSVSLSERSTIITALLENNAMLACQIAKDLNINLANYKYFLVASLTNEDKEAFINNKSAEIIARLSAKYGVIDTIVDGQLIMLSCTQFESINYEGQPISHQLYNDYSCHNIMIGEITELNDVTSMYSEYCSSINAAAKIYPFKKIFSFEQIHFSNYCNHLYKSSKKQKEMYSKLLAPLSNDKKNDLINTISTYYLDADSEVKETSELLYVHHTTIQNRLQKIHTKTKLNLSTLPDSYKLYVAVALARLND